MARDYKLRVRIEIVPADEGDDSEGGGAGIDGVDEEAVEVIANGKAVSIDDMEETLLENTYEVMRRALGKHFAEVSKRGLSTGADRAG